MSFFNAFTHMYTCKYLVCPPNILLMWQPCTCNATSGDSEDIQDIRTSNPGHASNGQSN